MRTRITTLVCVLAACGNVISGKQPDAPLDSPQGDPPSNTTCDPTGMFDAPVPLTELNTAGTEYAPRLTADELEIYFAASASGNASTFTIYRAQRSARSASFGAPVALLALHTAAGELDPCVSSDGLSLFFRTPIVTGEGVHLYVSTRASRIAEFNGLARIANISSPNVADNDIQPFVTADGQELWFSSNRAGGQGSYDMYRATGNGAGFANVAEAHELNTTASEQVPVVSADKLTVYFSSTRSGSQDYDLWTAHRSTTSDGFPQPVPVTELNAKGTKFGGWLSADNCRFYFSSNAAGQHDLYVATRHPM